MESSGFSLLEETMIDKEEGTINSRLIPAVD